MTAFLSVEVAFATPQRQVLKQLVVPLGTTARQAVVLPALTEPGLDLAVVDLAIWGEYIDDPAAHVLQEGDRVEVLRPLLCDPKASRRAKGARRKK